MPVITITLGPTPSDVKKNLISALTSTAAEITNTLESSFIVLVDELPEDAIGVGGRTVQEIKSVRT